MAIPAQLLSPKPPETIPPPPANLAGNLNYEYYEGEFDKLPEFGTLTPTAKGECDGFDIGSGYNDQRQLHFRRT